MITTAFLSMWISNTATAAMMLAIAHAVLRELEDEGCLTHRDGEGGEPPQSPVQIVYAKRYNSASGELREEVTVQLERASDGEGEGGEGEEGEGEGGEGEGGEGEAESLLGARPVEESEVSGRDDEEIDIVKERRDSEEERRRDSEEEGEESQPAPNRTLQRMSKVLMLGVAYAANIGGTATLTGTGPNIILSGLSVR